MQTRRMARKTTIRQCLIELNVVQKLLVRTDGGRGVEEEDIAVEFDRRACGEDVSELHGRIEASDEVVVSQRLAVEERNGDRVILPESEQYILRTRSKCKLLVGNNEGVVCLCDCLENRCHAASHVVVSIVNIAEVHLSLVTRRPVHT